MTPASVSVSDVLGDMNVETVAAGVDLEDAAGYLTVKTVGGSFHASVAPAASKFLPSAAISGLSICAAITSARKLPQATFSSTANFFPTEPTRLKNYSGVIEVRFSPGDSFDLSATSLERQSEQRSQTDAPSHPRHFLAEVRQRSVWHF